MRFHLSTAFVETVDVLALSSHVEQWGWGGFYVSDHLFFPKDLKSKYTYTPDGVPMWGPEADWPDAWCLISALAARTSSMEFTTGVYVAPARDLVTVAKQVGTAAVISGGRVNLGVAAGWCEEEFVATGQHFSSRGRRLDEMIPALRALWGEGWVEHHGAHYDLPPMMMNPRPPAPVPILVGGLTDVAMRRAARLGDGWLAGPVHSLEEVWAALGRMSNFLEEAGRTREGFRIFMSPPVAPSRGVFDDLAEAGMTDLVTAPWMLVPNGRFDSSLDEKLHACEVVGAQLHECVGDS